MNCLICLKVLNAEVSYHRKCQQKLFGSTKVAARLNYPRQLFIQEVRKAVVEGRMSISGVQPKAQMTMIDSDGPLVIAKSGGEYILKPSPEDFPEAANNEHLSMQMAKVAGFDVSECGLIGFADNDDLAYIIRRFDRFGEEKLHHEDMMQIFGINNANSESKYDDGTYLDVLMKLRELAGLGVSLEGFKRITFNYFIGNDDYHLKNISIMHGTTPKLTPMYDCLNSQIYSGNMNSPLALQMTEDDMELPYYGKMQNGFYARADFIRLAELAGIKDKPVQKAVDNLLKYADAFCEMIGQSTLSANYQAQYLEIVTQRVKLLSLKE